MKIIGLTGPAGAGKDAAADALCFKHRYARIALADPIRAGVTAIFGLPNGALESRADKERCIEWIGKSPRQLMQTLGTEWGREHVAHDIWLKITERKIQVRIDNAKYTGIQGIVVTDIRFPNEAEWLLKRGTLVHIVRNKSDLPALDSETAQHVSEQGIKPLDDAPILINDGTLEDLYASVGQLIKALK